MPRHPASSAPHHMQSVLRAIGVDIPAFKNGLGVRLAVAKTGKITAFVNINGRDWGTSLCTRNSQCGTGSVCTLGICSIQCECTNGGGSPGSGG